MALTAKLQLGQSQALVMTPQLMQSIRLLQLTHMELERFIDEEIERNPLLDKGEPGAETEAVEPGTDEEAGRQDDWFDSEPVLTAEDIARTLDSSLENLFPDDPGTMQRLGPDLAAQWKSAAGAAGGQGVADNFDMDDLAAAPVSLAGHVGEQIALAFSDPVQLTIARALADELDEAGYLQADAADLAARLGVSEAEIRGVLETCRNFAPAGLFASNLADCLALQLAERDRLDPAMKTLLANLDLLARRDFAALKKLCGVDEEDLIDMLSEIRTLDPRPGNAFAGGPGDAIVADVEVREADGGGWSVELNAATLPRVLVDRVYYAEVSRRVRGDADRAFLSQCLQDANWLTRSLDQRARTILKVATEIVRQQGGFLAHGVRYLKPLNLKTVAEAIGMHESTVSRVTANKYMLTPRGVFELRYFFTVPIPAAGGGDAHSSESVRDRIRELIDAESPGDILSDDAMVDMLGKSGIEIARRTVAKYREAMNIPSSVQRRREKRAMAAAGR